MPPPVSSLPVPFPPGADGSPPPYNEPGWRSLQPGTVRKINKFCRHKNPKPILIISVHNVLRQYPSLMARRLFTTRSGSTFPLWHGSCSQRAQAVPLFYGKAAVRDALRQYPSFKTRGRFHIENRPPFINYFILTRTISLFIFEVKKYLTKNTSLQIDY